MPKAPTGTVTFLFTDIDGALEANDRLGDRYPAVLAEHQRQLREVFALHKGYEVDSQGESFFVAFQRAADALVAAAAIQKAIGDWKLAIGDSDADMVQSPVSNRQSPISIRISLHT